MCSVQARYVHEDDSFDRFYTLKSEKIIWWYINKWKYKLKDTSFGGGFSFINRTFLLSNLSKAYF